MGEWALELEGQKSATTKRPVEKNIGDRGLVDKSFEASSKNPHGLCLLIFEILLTVDNSKQHAKQPPS